MTPATVRASREFFPYRGGSVAPMKSVRKDSSGETRSSGRGGIRTHNVRQDARSLIGCVFQFRHAAVEVEGVEPSGFRVKSPKPAPSHPRHSPLDRGADSHQAREGLARRVQGLSADD